MTTHKHLDLVQRFEIEHCLNKRLSFKTIGYLIGKDCTTVSKEIRNHIVFEKKGAPYRKFNNCAKRTTCAFSGDICTSCTRKHNKCSLCGSCTSVCQEYVKEECPLLNKPPYVCNGCQNLSRCTLEKCFYSAKYAKKEYELIRSESRSGFNISEEELAQLDSV